MAKPAEPRRLRWSVPRVDVSTNQWLDTQNDISQSLQLLIRESIQRDGYIDVVNRPIEQLPRRGRPPQSESELQATGAEPEAGTANTGAPVPARAEVQAVTEQAAQVGTQPAEVDEEPFIETPAQHLEPPVVKAAPSGLDAFLTH
ncbi:hypothetical protein [Pseudarthrobacter sp. GA104]|uniref:hypothetical protein n=1 Tax=Pseudarthrobacter sp. GA104 TaxID=2676311 RepID=UPI0012FA5365|nr:hypothetical protein [Pseudarthrobacter sp. GA104]MUU73427.1 hypothetical protein [Pseudarthrobacter sp. GA104]